MFLVAIGDQLLSLVKKLNYLSESQSKNIAFAVKLFILELM